MPQTDRRVPEEVIVAYANGIDDRDFDAYRQLFSADVVFEGFDPDPIVGVDAWLAFVENALAPYRQTQHMLGPPRVQIDGDTAHMRTDLQALHFLREPKGKIFWLWGVYRSQLVRDGGSWLIQKHRLDVRGTRREGDR